MFAIYNSRRTFYNKLVPYALKGNFHAQTFSATFIRDRRSFLGSPALAKSHDDFSRGVLFLSNVASIQIFAGKSYSLADEQPSEKTEIALGQFSFGLIPNLANYRLRDLRLRVLHYSRRGFGPSRLPAGCRGL